MKKAKIILACVAILAIVGGALAFKAKREAASVFTVLAGNKTISLTVGTVVYTTTVPNCSLVYATTLQGPIVNASSTTIDPNVTTIFKSLGHADQIAPYTYCTLWRTRTTVPD